MVTCPRCGRSNEGKYRFCLGCGASLSVEAKPASGAVPPFQTSPADAQGPSDVNQRPVPPRAPVIPPRAPALRASNGPVLPPPPTNPAAGRPPVAQQGRPPSQPIRSHVPAHSPDYVPPRGPGVLPPGPPPTRDTRLPSPPPTNYNDMSFGATEPVPEDDLAPVARQTRASTAQELETGSVRRVPKPALQMTPASGVPQIPPPPMAPTPRSITGQVQAPFGGSTAFERNAGVDRQGMRSTGILPTPLVPPTGSGLQVSVPPRAITVNPRIAPGSALGSVVAPPPSPAAVVQVQPSPRTGGPASSVTMACDRCGTAIPATHSFCGVCGAPNVRPKDPVSSTMAPAAHTERIGSLALIDDNGQEAQQFALVAGENRLGAGPDCHVRFADDGFLAGLHCAIDAAPGRVVLRPIDTANGTYLRITTPIEIHHGDRMRVGQEVLAFERLERMTPEVGRGGETEVVGWAVPRGVWGRLCQVGLQRQVANAYLLANPDVFLGRERGDILFPKDGFVSGSHAVLSDRNGRAFLKDLGSSNGTFVRVKQETPLRAGDLFLLGRNLMRVRLGS